MAVGHLPFLPERHGKRIFQILLRIRHKGLLLPEEGVLREGGIHHHIRHQLQSGIQVFRQNLAAHAQGIVACGGIDGPSDVLQKTRYVPCGTRGGPFQQAFGHQIRHPGVMFILRTAAGLEGQAGIGQREGGGPHESPPSCRCQAHARSGPFPSRRRNRLPPRRCCPRDPG